METIEGVKQVAREKGLNLADIATQLHITANTLYRSLKGDPKLSTLQKVANILHCSVSEIIEGQLKDNSETANAVITCNCPYCKHEINIKVETLKN